MSKRKWLYCSMIALLVGAFVMAQTAYGQSNAPENLALVKQITSGAGPQKVAPSGKAELTFVGERTQEDIDQFLATHELSGPQNVPFRPTMPMSQFLALKAASARLGPTTKPFSPGLEEPNLLGHTTFFGGIQTDNTGVGQPLWFPPDSGGAVGSTQFVQPVNDYINVYSKGGALLSHVSLQAFMGSPTFTFDPNVAYDPDYGGRWIVTADAFPASGTVCPQNFFIAVSKTSSALPAAGWYVYFTDTCTFTGGNFWDYPHFGYDQNGLIFTANVFSNSTGGFLGATIFSLSKSQAYNGHPQGFAFFSGIANTTQASVYTSHLRAPFGTTDTNGFAWLALADPSASVCGTFICMLALEGSSTPNAEFLFGYFAVAGAAAYTIPPDAPQTCGGAGNLLQTLDGRFQNHGAQVGDEYYQAQAVGVSGSIFSFARYRRITGLLSFAPAEAETALLFASGPSFDFNPSIAADSNPFGVGGAGNHFVMAWAASNVSGVCGGANVQERAIGKHDGGAIGAQQLLSTTTNNLTGNPANASSQRFGDYSQVSLDPGNSTSGATTKFWATNETVFSASTWGTVFGSVHF